MVEEPGANLHRVDGGKARGKAKPFQHHPCLRALSVDTISYAIKIQDWYQSGSTSFYHTNFVSAPNLLLTRYSDLSIVRCSARRACHSIGKTQPRRQSNCGGKYHSSDCKLLTSGGSSHAKEHTTYSRIHKRNSVGSSPYFAI